MDCPTWRIGLPRLRSHVPLAGLRGGLAVAGLVLFLGFGTPAAWAAGSGVSPDPAPQSAPSSGPAGPSPDPSPQAATQPSTGSASSSQSAAPVVSQASSTRTAVVSPNSTERTATTTATPAVHPSSVTRRPARVAIARVHHRARSIALDARRLTSPWRLNPLYDATALGARTLPAPRNGLLLLGGALALAVLALASGSLLRLLRQMEGVRTR